MLFSFLFPPYLQLAPPMDWEQYGQDWQIFTGLFQGSLLLSTQGQPRKPGSQAAQRCLIMKFRQDQCWMVCQHHPVPMYFSLAGEDAFLTQHPLRVMAYTVPRSSVQTVTRTAGIQLSRCVRGELPLHYSYLTKSAQNETPSKIFFTKSSNCRLYLRITWEDTLYFWAMSSVQDRFLPCK